MFFAPMIFCVLFCSWCLIPICLSSVLLLPLPPSSAFSRGTSGETRTSRRQMGKWQRSGNAGWGPPADSPHHRGPNTQGLTHLPPAAQHRCGPGGTAPTPPTRSLKQTLFSALDPPHATTPDPPSKSWHCHTHAAFLHWWNMRALSVVFEISFSGRTKGTDEL